VDTTSCELPAQLPERGISVANKCDLLPPGFVLPPGTLPVSSLTGDGFDQLIDAMIHTTGTAQLSAGQSLAAINARHKSLLESASEALRAARTLVGNDEPPELSAMELRSALDALGRIVGASGTEDILGEIFSRFCIGK